jgi:hypothetical protein
MKSGKVDQPGGMISEEGQEEGYALLCVAYPQGDCSVQAIPEVGAWQHSHTWDVLLCGFRPCSALVHYTQPGPVRACLGPGKEGTFAADCTLGSRQRCAAARPLGWCSEVATQWAAPRLLGTGACCCTVARSHMLACTPSAG